MKYKQKAKMRLFMYVVVTDAIRRNIDIDASIYEMKEDFNMFNRHEIICNNRSAWVEAATASSWLLNILWWAILSTSYVFINDGIDEEIWLHAYWLAAGGAGFAISWARHELPANNRLLRLLDR